MSGSLDAALLAAHERDDRAALVGLYRQAADEAERAADIDAACFFLVHAYVFALEIAHPDTPALHARLRAHGREN
ncbi:hypothetical protein [Aliiroseovarius sp. YM-037]|uniref:hypothetical protein n=1 Tax=Aliiroseovarius sp. YM-037 TaxID=3341728 RepID=UPI003A7FA35C